MTNQGALAGVVVIVTGASTGMGRAITGALASAGATLCLVARREGPLREAAAEARGAVAAAFPGDISDAVFAGRTVRAAAERFGRIDVLVNNAGTNTFHRNLADISVEDWRKVIETNLTGAFLFTRQVLPMMRAAGRGRIICVSSTAGLHPGAPAGTAYSASKSALHSLAGSINIEERRHGITACLIVPGETDTPNLELRPLPPTPEARRTMLRPEDVADAVLFAATRPERVAVEMIVLTPTVLRDYQADYERYVAQGHTAVDPD